MNRIHLKACILTSLLFTSLMGRAQSTPSTLKAVKNSGTLQCGVIREEEDYSKADVHGNRAAFDLDICKAIAAAVVGDNAKTVLQSFPDEPKAIEALRTGKIQVIATATPSFLNKTVFGIGFSPVVFVDGEGFMVLKSSGIQSPKDLAGKKVCYIDQTSNFDNLKAYAARDNVKLIPFPFEEQGEMEAAMYTGNCAAVTTDLTQLANTRARFNVRGKDFALLSQTISVDPLAVAYLSGDAAWGSAINATISALLVAEESGISAANIDARRNDNSDAVSREARNYFSPQSGMGALLQLDPDWAARALKAVGNYREMFDRDLGKDSPLQLPRGLSNLWNEGGMLYAPPFGPK